MLIIPNPQFIGSSVLQERTSFNDDNEGDSIVTRVKCFGNIWLSETIGSANATIQTLKVTTLTSNVTIPRPNAT